MIDHTKRICLFAVCSLFFMFLKAQQSSPLFTHADSLRGSMNPEREYNVVRYDVTINPDFENKSVAGINIIRFTGRGTGTIQVDLQEPLTIDSIIQSDGKTLTYQREGNAYHVVLGG